MAKRQKLTNNTDESNLGLMLSGDSVFSIPYFQRPYKWKLERLQQLERDVLQLVDGLTDTHFLGAIIFHGRPTNPSDPDIYEVIDGQQRLTTVFIYLCAVVKTLCKFEQYDEASGLFLKYIVINRPTNLISNSRLQSSKDDRKQLNRVIQDLLEDPQFSSKLQSFSFKSLPAVGSDSGRLWNNYKAALRFLSAQTSLETLERLRDIYIALLEQISVVQIDVLDPINGPKIFDSLNSRQEPMTTGDLVRNEIFSRVADSHPDEVESLDQQFWQPFYETFKSGENSLFDEYFFPFGLIKNPNLKKSGVYAYLRQQWKDEKSPASIIKDLASFQDAFMDIANGTNRQNHPKEIAAAIERVSEITPSSTYPFLMRLSNRLKADSGSHQDGLEVMSLIESFLVRRAICGHEPTGLHAVFKRLWEDCGGSPNATNVAEGIRKHKTVVWPSGQEVRSCVLQRPLYGSSITTFVLKEWNKSLGGDQPNAKPWIEHILPDTLSEDWKSDFDEEQHKEYKNRLANLLPLSQPMNQGLGNAGYPSKRSVYSHDSMFKGPREFAKEFQTWTPKDLNFRAAKLAEWVVDRWQS
ncbi:DUF262 domain-containing HNH endonuclease family protein [Alloacidobacterium sp.]|uniref:DUF262 domain-containing protein n=1 Tax=Alloacidobacterium sp. TaxID=2951999 RepID=UPI002D61B2F8|nr:DUF262 domain-containing HNH endonuclease family protein [Alloacidobacterium sp.]HYK36912.1 DUF262 domain-containing HNH endonuclease family protein [Alloacidobacterium sp.]